MHLHEILEMQTNSEVSKIILMSGTRAKEGMVIKGYKECFGDDENILYFYCVGDFTDVHN